MTINKAAVYAVNLNMSKSLACIFPARKNPLYLRERPGNTREDRRKVNAQRAENTGNEAERMEVGKIEDERDDKKRVFCHPIWILKPRHP